MKLFRDLFEHFQFTAVTLITTGMVVGLGLIGQYWLGPEDSPLGSQVLPAYEDPLRDSLDPALENIPNPQDTLLGACPF